MRFLGISIARIRPEFKKNLQISTHGSKPRRKMKDVLKKDYFDILILAKFGEIFLWIIATLATAQTWQEEHYVLCWWGSTNFGTMRARRFFFPELNKFSPKYSLHDSFMSSKPCSREVVLKAMIFLFVSWRCSQFSDLFYLSIYFLCGFLRKC